MFISIIHHHIELLLIGLKGYSYIAVPELIYLKSNFSFLSILFFPFMAAIFVFGYCHLLKIIMNKLTHQISNFIIVKRKYKKYGLNQNKEYQQHKEWAFSQSPHFSHMYQAHRNKQRQYLSWLVNSIFLMSAFNLYAWMYTPNTTDTIFISIIFSFLASIFSMICFFSWKFLIKKEFESFCQQIQSLPSQDQNIHQKSFLLHHENIK